VGLTNQEKIYGEEGSEEESSEEGQKGQEEGQEVELSR
jgi:hypothetical protein